SYLAACTSRIRLGTGASVLPLNDAVRVAEQAATLDQLCKGRLDFRREVRVAEQAATLDQLSKGRLDFGVGRGFIRDEFESFGIDMKESRERVEEGVDLIKAAWAGPTLEVKSKLQPPMS